MSELVSSRGAVVVTGASTGIGRHAAETLVARGFRVFAGARKKADLDALAAAGASPLEIDVASDESVTRAAARVSESLGGAPLVGLVNNAGIAVGGPVEYVALDEVRRQLEVNTYGALRATQAMMPFLRRPDARGRRGRIVNISSMAGRFTTPLLSPYCLSKHALEAMSDALRMELSPWSMPVVVIEPGVVKTPIWEKGDDEIERAVAALPEEGRARYEESARALASFFKVANTRGVSVEATTSAIWHALVDDRPRPRVVVGLDAKFAVMLQAVLPRRLLDRLYRRSLGI